MGPVMTASPGGRAPSVLRVCLLLLGPPLLLASCAPAGADRAASQVLEEVLESHRASLAGLQAPPPQPGPGAGGAGPRRGASSHAPGSVAALLGQTPDAVLSALGPPTRRRPEGQAEIWLYQGAHCALDVVLYREASSTRVAWAAARAAGTETRTEARCLAELVAG